MIKTLVCCLLLISSIITAKADEPVDSMRFYEVCISGHAYAVAHTGRDTYNLRGITMVQVYTKAVNIQNPPQPKRCFK